MHRVGVGPDRLGCLALGDQVQPERADLGLKPPGIQLLARAGRLGRGAGTIAALSCSRTIRSPAVSGPYRRYRTSLLEPEAV
jgi:hypothetical protein